MVEHEVLPQLARAVDLLPDPVFLVAAHPSRRGAGRMRILYRNLRAGDLVASFHGSVVEDAAARVLAHGTTDTIRWRPSGAPRTAAYTVRLVPVDAGTVAVQCSRNDELASVLVDAYRVADEAWATLSGALDAAPDAFVVLDVAAPGTVAGPSGAPAPEPVVRHHNARAVTLLEMSSPGDGRRLGEACSPRWASRLSEAMRVAGAGPTSLRVHDEDEAGWTGSYDVTSVATGRGPGQVVVVVVRDATDDERVHRRLHEERSRAEHHASHDELTGLLNRRSIRAEVARLLRAGPTGRAVAVVFADLDGFKTVNDVHGHAAGDSLLVAVARRLARAAGPGFVAGRYGGDEFLLARGGLPADWSPAETLGAVADELSRPVWVQGAVLAPRASLGVHVACPDRLPADRDVDAVIAAADADMYRHKPSRHGAR